MKKEGKRIIKIEFLCMKNVYFLVDKVYDWNKNKFELQSLCLINVQIFFIFIEGEIARIEGKKL